MVALSPIRLQKALQSVAQSIQWTYSLFWNPCPQQGVLVWGDGYYNGAIKTRKTVQPAEVSAEEVTLQRSQQLRELYESLSAGEASQQQQQQLQLARRPSAALSPEDLTESEWFYLMCISFSFPPGSGLPGKAFARRRHVWLTRANEADSKVFSRAILAKSAQIQTVVCIPLMDGVLELGTTEMVEEDTGLIKHAKSFFAEHHEIQSMPALSEQSTSNPAKYNEPPSFQVGVTMHRMHAEPTESDRQNDEDDDEEDDDHDDDDDEEDEIEGGSGSEVGTLKCSHMITPTLTRIEGATTPNAEHDELMQLGLSQNVRLGSPDDCSNNLNTQLQMVGVCCNTSGVSNHQREDETYHCWNFLHEDICSELQQQSSVQAQELSQEDAHYSETVTTILRHNSSRGDESKSNDYFVPSRQTAFAGWNSTRDHPQIVLSEGTSQWLLKTMLFRVPTLHCRYKDENSPPSIEGEGGGSRSRKGAAQEEPSANHVLAERRRREKLNERFIVLRSLVPFVTKMDKASILGDAIEYVKQLRKRMQDLESRNRQMESLTKTAELQRPGSSKDPNVPRGSGSPQGSGVDHVATSQQRAFSSDKRKIRVLEGTRVADAPSTNVQVSIIEADALLEMQCPYKEGLLLKIMQTIHELRLEIMSIQSSSVNGTLFAELRAKVKEMNGKRASILEVKKAIYRVFSNS
ncbi:basic helix-loop-helix protein A-like isoform X1 [Ananas comosus]|uniref:Basic helix-loop-helix protein A-like isoform X1 n=1 Tax=Ananas comosus TaxID=4615 RepID=A0A6P5HF04_ANACO|nr:basic helix-loop-helix protein A-like isoform X1 [Ananas comosus]